MPDNTKAVTKSKQLSLRLTPEAINHGYHLAHIWSPVKPLSIADVVTEALRRAYEAETPVAKPKKAKTK